MKLAIGNTKHRVGAYFWDLVAANAIFVTTAVTLFYIYRGPAKVKQFYDELFMPLPIWIWVLIDMFVHFIPVAILGYPQLWWSFPIALVMLITYVRVMKNHFENVYRVDISTKTIENIGIKWGIPYMIVLSLVTYFTTTLQK